MAPLGRSSCALILLALNAAAEPQISSPAAHAFLTHKAGEPLLTVQSAAEVQRGCTLPCSDPQSIAVYRAEIGVAGKELGLSADEIKAAEQNYIPNGVPRKRAASDSGTPASRTLEAQALARMLSDPHVSPQAKQKLAARMESIAHSLGGLELVDGAGATIVMGADASGTGRGTDSKLLPRVQLPVGFKAFSPEPPMLSMRDPTLLEKIEGRIGLMDYIIRPENKVPVSTLSKVPDGCALFSNVTNQPCENGDALLLRGEKDEGRLEIIRRALRPGEDGDTYYISTGAGTRLLTVIEISDDKDLRGTEAESFTVYHELRHFKTQKDIAQLFNGHYPPEAAMTNELLTQDAEQEQFIKKHPDILTMNPPENRFDKQLWALARVRVGPVDHKDYADDTEADRMLIAICHEAPEGSPCGGAETTHAYLKQVYANANYPTPRDPETIRTLDAFLQSEDNKQDVEYAAIWDASKKACAENWTDACKKFQ